MALRRGSLRFQNIETNDIKYFVSPPEGTNWLKIGTNGSKNWQWVTNGIIEIYLNPNKSIPDGFSSGRIKK